VNQALALFIFAREYARGRPDIEKRVDQFAERLVACARTGGIDEILIVGHSLGAAIAVDALARALAIDADLGRHGPTLCLLTAGGTIPQVTLHPAAVHLRASTRRVAEETVIAWAEYQARDDAINFYRFDPVTLTTNVDGGARKPHIRRVHLHEMLTMPTFRRHRWHFMRLHYQFVMANERRSMYDYFMLVCGPLAFATVINAPGGPAELFADNGSCVAMQTLDRAQTASAPLKN
jgi:pimeloyl-ACP methyl ester carboxylesterase